MGSNHLKPEPGNRPRRDEGGVGGGRDRHGPDGARVPGGLPRGTGHATLKRVGAEEVGNDLFSTVIEQGGLRPEECPGEASTRGQADVVLSADSVTFEERLVPHWYLNVGGHRWR